MKAMNNEKEQLIISTWQNVLVHDMVDSTDQFCDNMDRMLHSVLDSTIEAKKEQTMTDKDTLTNRIINQRRRSAPHSFKMTFTGSNVVNWDQAPDWANYWAMDSNGKAYWYAEYPILDLKITDWESFDITDDAPDFGFPSELWDESLEKRPDEQEQALDEMVKDAEDLDLYDNEYCDNSSRLSDSLSKVKSDGGSTSYYYLPDHATELRHLISHKSMSKSRGDIFKACYRLGEKDGADVLYDLNKMKFFVEDLIEMYHRGEHL